jgi:hypothetical protein
MIPDRMFERGRRGEFLVAKLLQSRGWGVVPCYDYSGSDGKKAPRLMFERRALRNCSTHPLGEKHFCINSL